VQYSHISHKLNMSLENKEQRGDLDGE